MAIQPTQPQGIGGVLDTTFQLYKSSLGVLWPVFLLLTAVGSPPSIYLAMNGAGGGVAAGAGVLAAMSSPTYWVIYLVSIVAMMWVIGAIYLAQHAIGTDQEMSVGAALQASVGRVLPLVAMMILFTIALVIGYVLLIIPGVILTVSLMLATALVMFEDKGPVDSLIGSHRLVWGNWWRTLVILSIGGILVFVIYLAVALVVGLVLPFVGLATDEMVLSLLSTLIIGVIVNVLVTPFFSAMLIAVYWDLKLRKEGGDLAARVGALNAA
jgi:hypothetical protein